MNEMGFRKKDILPDFGLTKTLGPNCIGTSNPTYTIEKQKWLELPNSWTKHIADATEQVHPNSNSHYVPVHNTAPKAGSKIVVEILPSEMPAVKEEKKEVISCPVLTENESKPFLSERSWSW